MRWKVQYLQPKERVVVTGHHDKQVNNQMLPLQKIWPLCKLKQSWLSLSSFSTMWQLIWMLNHNIMQVTWSFGLIASDASYLSELNARSTCQGYFFLSDNPHDPSKPPLPQDSKPTPNAPHHVLCSIMHEIVSSATEAELCVLFHNCKDGCIREGKSPDD
jgi:hypothetical protein